MSTKNKVIDKRKGADILKDQVKDLLTNNEIASYVQKIKWELEYLKKILRQWSYSKNGTYLIGTNSELIKSYVSAINEYYEEDQFNQYFSLLQNFEVNLFMIQSEKIIFKSFKLFPKAIWPIRFHNKFVSKLRSYSNADEVIYIMAQVYRAASGTMCPGTQSGGVRPLLTKNIPFNRFITLKLMRQRNLFIHIGVEKVPIIKNGVIRRYEFTQYMHFLDILGDMYVENKAKLDERMNYFTGQIFIDAAKKDHSDEIEIDREIFGKHQNKKFYFFKEYLNEYTGRYEYYDASLPDKEIQQFLPIPFKPYYVSNAEQNTVIYDEGLKRWLSKDHLTILERKKILEYQKQISDVMVKRFVDFQSAKTLVDLLTKIPNFKINLTDQEKDVIGENGNVLAIGRSGTGKTTCAVLRLFSIQMLFKIRMSLYKKKYEDTIKGVRCGSDDLDAAAGLHCIFLTASPVLTHEIQRYYKKLTVNIKTQLDKKKKRVEEEEKKRQEEEKARQEREKLEAGQESFENMNEVEEEIKEPSANSQNVIQNLAAPVNLQPKKSAEELEQEREIHQQFQGIELKEDVNNEEFKEEEEDIDELKNKFEQSINKFHSLFDLKQADYPGFFTVRSFILMIDGALQRPFFIRSKNTIVGEDSKASWHNERKGVMMIENYYRGEEEEKDVDEDKIQQEFNYSDEEQLEHEYLRQIQLRENKEKQQLTKKLQKNKKSGIFSFEVDYEYFVVHFWPRVVKKYYSSRNITAHLVWTQIYSTIKGSAEAHQYPGQYLTQHAYINTTTNTFLTKEEKLDIYETFCQYQRWKIRAGGYDIMDAVNYILNIIRFRGYEGPQIHYVMIDEVQDLPHAIVYLLSKTATYGVFYSGDTAQTIAKGVGFRFCDLNALFANLQLKKPIIKHLSVNFRSHNNILQLANSVVSSLEILFPKTIDRLKKEVSDLKGPKPMILASSDQQLLFYVLCGGEEHKVEGYSSLKKPPLQFGCDQVIIVRDQQSKSKVPAMLQHALCLTIYEAKGLEFNDVILFNFFEESPCPEKWHLLKSLNVTAIEVEKEEYERNLSRHAEKKQKPKIEGKQEQQEVDEEVQVEQYFNKEKNVYEVKKITSKDIKKFKDINDYAQLCSQLKLLYTAITRPKKTLIIYDEGDAAARAPIERLWERLNVIQIITKELVLESVNKKSMSEEVKIFETIVTSTDKSQWRQQGLKMYARGYFDQAMKCFDKSGSIDLYMKAEANKYADEATKTLIEMQSQRNMIKQGGYAIKEMTNQELHKLKAKIKLEEHASLKKFEEAGRIFDGLLMFKQAGQCFFSGKFFEKAFQSFCKAFMHKQAAESLEMQNKYRQAAEYYEKDQNYLKVIECLDMGNQWFVILEKIQKFAFIMTEYEKQALLKKYSALALEQLVYEIQFQNQEESSKPQNNRVEVIVEKQSDEEDEWDSQEDPELAAEREYERKMSQESNPSRKQSQVSEQQKGLVSIKESVYEQLGTKEEAKQQQKAEENSMSFSALNTSEQVEEKKEKLEQGVKSIDESFGDLNNSGAPIVLEGMQQEKADLESIESSFSDLNSKYQNQLLPDLQSIKSMVDPDDVWVKNSISEITHKLHSQYSVIDDQEENYNINVKIIKTKGNIFVQDEIMRKIVNIVSIINSSVEEFFKQFKGYQSLITVSSGDKPADIIDNRPEISQFDDVDPKFINIILDTLESFKLFKLCLFVCNRYHLPGKAGRYLISLGMKYSTNCISNNIVNPILLAPSSYRKTELEKGILASIAIHSIYQNVNAEFLKIKVTQNDEDNKNTLGSYFIQGLILQGLYKKAVFMVNPQQSLKILSNYNDFDAYNSIFRQKILKDSNLGPYAFFENLKNAAEVNYTTILLKQAIFEYCVVKRFQSISQRYYKEFQSQATLDVRKRLSQFAIPSYLPFTKALFSLQAEDFIFKLKDIISNGYKILTSGPQLQNLDLVCTLLAVIHNEQMQSLLVQSFDNDLFLEFYRCANYIKTVLRKIAGSNALVILQSVLSMHQCYKISYCKSMTFVNDTFCFVHRTSTIANELVENQKAGTSGFAYFFEQDYNYILTKTSRVTKIISKKYQEVLHKLYKKRIDYSMYQSAFLHEDWVAFEEESIIKKALSYDVDILGDPKKKKKEEAASRKKSKDLRTGYDFKSRGREHVVTLEESSDSEDQEYVDKELKFYRYSTNKKMRYLANSMLHWFNLQSNHAKEVVEGRFLYGCGINSSYREYTEKQGGFNLYDAMEFQRFKRVDLFAQNILSVFDKLTLFTRQNLLGEILILLLLQYKSLQQPQGFSVSLTSDLLKYLEKLQFSSTLAKQKEKVGELSPEEVNHLLANNVQCRFSYVNNYVSEMSSDDLAVMICDYLELLQEQGASQYVDYSKIILCYAINIGKNSDINECLRKVIKQLGPRWKNQSLHYLIDNKSLGDYENKRRSLLNSPVKQIHEVLHQIIVENKGNLEKTIAQSEFDYEVEGRILKARARAVSKIEKWWKAKRIQLKNRGGAANYFELAATAQNIAETRKPTALGDIRLIRMIHKFKTLGDIDLLIKTEKAKTELLSFYLTTTISSSLDFHFILMSLNKIEQCRKHYFQYISQDIDELHEFQIDEIHEEMSEMLSTIEVWKKDEKWLRDKNINLKKKKVFQVKWMTKNIGIGNLLKKRAGLKKQAILQDKRKVIKRSK